MAEAEVLVLSGCASALRNSPATPTGGLVYSHQDILLEREEGSAGPRYLSWINKASLPDHSYQVVLEYGSVKQPSSSLGFTAALEEYSIFRLRQRQIQRDPTASLKAYADTALVNGPTGLAILNPFDPVRSNYEVTPHHSEMGDPSDFRWAFYPVEYYDAIECKATPSTAHRVTEDGLDSHHNPVFPSAAACEAFTREHPEQINIVGSSLGEPQDPWWGHSNLTGPVGVPPPDFCTGTRTPGNATFPTAGACLLATVPTIPGPISSTPSSFETAPLPKVSGTVVLGLLGGLFGLVVLWWLIFLWRSRVAA